MDEEVSGYISVTPEAEAAYYMSEDYQKISDAANQVILNQASKGEVISNPVRFPKELGEEHPFDFKLMEQYYSKTGLTASAANKITDSIMGDFTIETEDENEQTIIDSFVEESDFISVLRPWILEAVLKGNGFMDLVELKDNKLRVLNANRMYVKRNKKGKVLAYNQYNGNLNRISITKNTDVITFKEDEVAHLTINQLPEAAYGLGQLYPTLVTLNNYASAEIDLHKLISRKASAPYHVKVGQPGTTTQSKAIDDFSAKLQFMNNSTNWVTDGNVEITPLEMKDVGKNLTDASNHDVEQFAIGVQIPMVLLGVANIPEGLAKVQLEAYQRLIQSIRVVIEDVVETKILQPLLRSNGVSGTVDFVWTMPGEEEKNERLKTITDALKAMELSPELRAVLEKEYALVLGLEDVIDKLVEPEEARKRADEEARKREEEIKQPEVPGVKPTAKAGLKVTVKESPKEVKCECSDHTLTEDELSDMKLSEYVNITEIAGFNYSDYLVKILQSLKIYKFEELLAITESDIIEGLLPSKDVEKLRIILKDGFRNNRTIRQIEGDIKNSIDLKDRVKIQEDGSKVVTLSATARPNAIARTETVRLANQGLKGLYMDNDIKNYQYLAAMDDRTSQICQDLNGRVFPVADGQAGVNMPPMHVNCRSTIVGLVK